MDLTGWERTGELLASQAGRELEKQTVELGDNDPFIVVEGLNPKVAATLAMQGRLITSAKRALVSKCFVFCRKYRR